MAATTTLVEQSSAVLDFPKVLAPRQDAPDHSEQKHEPILRRQMPELDSIRGIAILAVVIYHGFYWQVDLTSFTRWQSILLTLAWPGRLGVNLFFVLSGFLITGLLLDTKSKPDYYKRFYVRRALRILPAYLAILFVLAAVRYAPVSFLALSLAYLSNLTPLFGVAIAYPVLWSLAVEEHFYFVWPAVVRKFSRHALLALSVGVIVISPVLRFLNSHVAQGFEFNDYTWNSLDGMACGAVVALLVRMWGQDRRKLLQLSCGFLAAAALLSPFAIHSRQTALGAAMQVVPWHFFFAAMLGAFPPDWYHGAQIVGADPVPALFRPHQLRSLPGPRPAIQRLRSLVPVVGVLRTGPALPGLCRRGHAQLPGSRAAISRTAS